MTTAIPFTKIAGTGNEFVLVDTVRQRVNSFADRWPALARALCSRREADVDGLLVLGRSRRADLSMRIFNRDGSEASMCGNGIRCLAWYAHRKGLVDGARFSIDTKAGRRLAEMRGAGRVRINMGAPRLLRCLTWPRLAGERDVEVDLVDSGVPHAVCWVKDIARLDVVRVGRALRRHRRFAPHGANVDFVEAGPARAVYDAALQRVVHRATLTMRTYERGVEGETQACGTGAVAAAAALVHTWMPPATPLGRESDLQSYEVAVRVPGGGLTVSLSGKQLFDTRQTLLTDAFLEGGVRYVASGTYAANGKGAP